MEEWKEYKLEQVCENIYSGGTPATMNKEYWNGELPWLSSGETGQKYIYSTEKTITRKGVDNSSTRYAFKDSTVVASAGQGYTRGQASYLKINTYVNQSVIVLKPNPNIIDSRFLYFNIDNRYNELRQLSDGTSTRGSLSGKIMKDLSIKLPPFPIQKKIATILSSLDDKIELNNKINTNLEQQAGTLFKNWFVDFEPVGGKMLEGWKVGTVSEIIVLHDSKRIPLSSQKREKMEKKYPYYGATPLMDYVDNYLFDGIFLLLGEDGTVIDSEGFPILQYVEGKFWVNNHAHILTGKNGFSVEMLYLLFSLTNVKDKVTGAVQPKISQGNLNSITAIIPTEEICKKFDVLIQPLFSQIRNLKQENERLSVLRDTLLPKLMNGEIEV